MIRRRLTLTIERRRTIDSDDRGDGSVHFSLTPNGADREYVMLAIGDVRRGEAVTPEEVVDVVRQLVGCTHAIRDDLGGNRS